MSIEESGVDPAPGHSPAWQPLAEALKAYRRGALDAAVVMITDAEPPRPFPIRLFYRTEADLEALEVAALHACRGRVLDVGAGAGAAAQVLQGRGHAVTALDALAEAVDAMRERGIDDARQGDIFTFRSSEPFDTVLLLMNGSMIAGTLGGLDRLLARCATLLRPGGRIVIDSTDLSADESSWTDDGRYSGEIHYQLEFQGLRGPPFPQLFVDFHTLQRHAARAGFSADLLHEGGEGAFLAALTLERPGPSSARVPPE